MTKLQDAAAIAKVTLGLLFASAFQVPMVWSSWGCPVSVSDSVQIAQFCIYRLCRHQQYVDKLREEALAWEDAPFGSMNSEMPYLDSFVKETARLSPGPICKRSLSCSLVLPEMLQINTVTNASHSVRASHMHGLLHHGRWMSCAGWQLARRTSTHTHARREHLAPGQGV